MRAAELWESTAEVAEKWTSESDRPAQAAEWLLHAKRLHIRAESLRKLARAGGRRTGADE